MPTAAEFRAEALAYLSRLSKYDDDLTAAINVVIDLNNKGGLGSSRAVEAAQNIMDLIGGFGRLEPPACLSAFHDRQVYLWGQYYDGAEGLKT